jgi:hypothetical protein
MRADDISAGNHPAVVEEELFDAVSAVPRPAAPPESYEPTSSIQQEASKLKINLEASNGIVAYLLLFLHCAKISVAEWRGFQHIHLIG